MAASAISTSAMDSQDEAATRRNSFDSCDSSDTHFMGGKSISHDNSQSDIGSDLVDELIATELHLESQPQPASTKDSSEQTQNSNSSESAGSSSKPQFKLGNVFKFNMAAPSFQPTPESTESDNVNSLAHDLESVTLNTNFTPSTPYVHKFRTEMCKNFELYGKCKFGDECSFAHSREQLMIKTDVSVLYKTKLCKKFSTTGYCPYGVRCQFIHDVNEANSVQNKLKPASHAFSSAKTFVPTFATKQAKADKTFSPVESKKECQQLQSATLKPQERELKVGPVASKVMEPPKPRYKQMFVHNFHVSVQEFQKKRKMYERKVSKKKYADYIDQPHFQYMNIYSSRVSRLPCFQEATAQYERSRLTNHQDSDDEDFDELTDEIFGYFHGDAQAYEKHLDKQISELNMGNMPSRPQELFF
jgi:hypothetical protein